MIDASALDRDPSAPLLNAQLADHLRQLVASRDLAPGDALPSEHDLAVQAGVSRSVVRDALDLLDLEGLIERRQGAATRIAQPPPVRRMSMDRYQRELSALAAGNEPDTAFVTENHATFDDLSLDPLEITKEKATTQDADYLALRKGVSVVLRRRMVMRIRGVPLQIHRSALPFKLAGHTELADRATYPRRGGTLADLHVIGVVPTAYWESWSARMPNRTERHLLDMKATGPVWDITRVFYRDAQPVEASRVIASCARLIMQNRGHLYVT